MSKNIFCMEQWVGKSIREVNFRAKYQVTILGIKKEDQTDLIPDADHIFEKNEHLMIVGRKEDVDRILEHIE